MSVIMVDRRLKINKKLKGPKAVLQKTKFGPKYKWFKILCLEFFFWKIYFEHTMFLYVCPEVSVDTVRVFFYFRFSSRNFQSQQKRILRTSTHLALKLICFCNAAKKLSDFIFSSNHVSGVIKNICIAPFLGTQELHSRSCLSENAFIFQYISLIKFLFQRRSKVLSSWGWDGRRLNNFLKTAFHFNWKFWKFNYLVAFRYFYL